MFEQPDPMCAPRAYASALASRLEESEDWLMRRVLSYAAKYGYTKYTSTLEEAWRVSISGLSESLVLFIAQSGFEADLRVDEDVVHDPAVAFGVREAQAHRSRGVSLQMFMSLMKYYRRTFLDLANAPEQSEFAPQLVGAVERFFDRVEIGYCVEWSGLALDTAFRELQDTNREVVNEKNKYLTLFQSLDAPVFLLDADGHIDNLNQSASRLLGVGNGIGEGYYSGVGVGGALQMLREEVSAFLESGESESAVERELPTSEGDRTFAVMFKRMLDVSGKFGGATVTLADVTNLKVRQDYFHVLSTTDELTGVANRRRFLDSARLELARAVRFGRSVSVALMDVDEFKHINDTYGHAAGDGALQTLASACRRHTREIDLFARFGGDEFALLLPETGMDAALDAVERVRRSAASSEVDFDGGSATLTISAGVASLRDGETSLDALLSRADRALYRAKEAGGNRTLAESTDDSV